MVGVLLFAGIAMLTSGLVAIGFGIPVKEFSFGNTLIFSGTIVACTGIIVLSLWTAVRELRSMMQEFGVDVLGPSRMGTTMPAPNAGGFLSNRDQPEHGNADMESAAPSLGPSPWRDETGPRERGRPKAAATPEPDEAAQAAKQRRNLLFSSSSRKERERPQGRTTELPAVDLRPAPLEVAPSSESVELPAPSFEDAWPRSDRSRTVEAAPRRSGRPPLRFGEGGAAAQAYPPAAARNEDRPAVTILKSGVVDGMAYSLYSDGSIEAQMPEGLMRFASIDELRAHLDQRA